jgi:peroxiredoxin Q/BCP
LRQDYPEFVRRNIEIIALGPDGPNAFKRYWESEDLPFIGCADIRSLVAAQYQQDVNWFKFGRMPAVFLIDPQGRVIFQQYGDSMSDIPTNTEVFSIFDKEVGIA